MTANFTLRDFLVYFSSGAFFLLSFNLIFFEPVLKLTEDFFTKHSFIKEFSGIIIILAIPLVYILGHLLHGIGFLSLQTYKAIHFKLNKWDLRKFKFVEFLRCITHFFMYKNKVINSVIEENKKNKTWNSSEAFWESCALLQVQGTFGPANYWYTLNDLFKGLYTTTLFATIICLICSKWVLGTIFCGLMLMCQFRAIQFANSFVMTVRRLNKFEVKTQQ